MGKWRNRLGHRRSLFTYCRIFLQVENKEVKILIPGCGNAHEAELLLEEGFTNITLLDIAQKACEVISQKFSHHEVEVICEDFFSNTKENMTSL